MLLKTDDSQEYQLYEAGIPISVQAWDFPSRDQCMSCHTANANFVLGVKTHQLNGEYAYPEGNIRMNQLSYLSEQGILDKRITSPSQYPRAYAIDDASASLSLRILSYLDANCSSA